MGSFRVDTPAGIDPDLLLAAQQAGFQTVKAMALADLRKRLVAYRESVARESVATSVEAARAQALADAGTF